MKVKTLMVIPALLLVSSLKAQELLPDIVLHRLDGSETGILDEIKSNDRDLTIISFWATWCKPCRNELENIALLYPEWQEDYNMEIIAVSIDDTRTQSQVKPYINSQSFDYRVLLDPNKEFFRAVNGTSPPLTILVNSKGEILEIEHGYIEGNEYLLEEKLEEFSKP